MTRLVGKPTLNSIFYYCASIRILFSRPTNDDFSSAAMMCLRRKRFPEEGFAILSMGQKLCADFVIPKTAVTLRNVGIAKFCCKHFGVTVSDAKRNERTHVSEHS